MLNICTFLWGSKYDISYVQKWYSGIKRHLLARHQMFLCTDDMYRPGIKAGAGKFWIDGCDGLVIVPIIRDLPLLEIKGCFARLRLFDPEWQSHRGFLGTDRIVSIDLDAIITGQLDPLFERPEPFVIFGGANTSNPCPYNGSIWMLNYNYRPDVWSDFSIEAANKKTKIFDFADDQGWFEYKLPDAAVWKAGSSSGVYAFYKNGWPKGDDLPSDARIVAFPGWRDPKKFEHLKWVQERWRD